jgi:GNAT superfamily N-acetyltransferase
MPAPEITIRRAGREQADQHADEYQAMWAEVYADPPWGWGDEQAAYFARRLRTQARQPGFVLAEARHGAYLVGFGLGLPLRPTTDWWHELTAPVPADVTTEHPGRTFALADLLVRAAWRRQGIGRDLYECLLAGRAEERATLALLPAAASAQAASQAWGWRKVARRRDPRPGSPVLDVLVTPLPGARD